MVMKCSIRKEDLTTITKCSFWGAPRRKSVFNIQRQTWLPKQKDWLGILKHDSDPSSARLKSF